MEYIDSPTQSKPGRLRRVPGFYRQILKEKKNVHFAAGRDLERVKIFDMTKAVTHHEPEERLPIDKVPLLFKCKSSDEIIQLVESGRAKVSEMYRGHNALHWHCNAKSTSPSLIETLVLRYGIDINAVDQCVGSSHHNPVMMRHTALGLACRNANANAVHTLLRLGASPSGLDRAAHPTHDPRTGKRLLYPSPLQVLLCQPIHGPRPACPWTYHLGEEDDDAEPHFRGEQQKQPVCADCTRGYHIWEPWPASEREAAAWRAHRRRCWHTQIRRVGARLQRCAQLLVVDYGGAEARLRRGDDPRLWTALEFLLETAWRFLGAAAVCWRDGDEDVSDRWGRLVSGVPTEIVFPPFGEICDLLLEEAGYGDDDDGWAGGPAIQARGQQRLVALIAQHPDFERFREGEFFDIDAELKAQQAEDALSRAAAATTT
ncbi:hypothetical protein F5X96DRAFT_678135 [Biscogniauxia mediterranea]|nr:hypothetical protein F5X96DRAFT_678135 [Biscogniauxia mediterranea]